MSVTRHLNARSAASPPGVHTAKECLDEPRAPMITPAERLFEALYVGQSGTLELRTVPASQWRDFVPVIDGAVEMARVERFVRETTRRKINAYFGVALRLPIERHANGRWPDGAGAGVRCTLLTTLFVDADYKKLGEAETRRRIDTFPLPPSIVVCSGGGLHVYWRLREPIDLQTNMALAKSILRRLAKTVADIVDEQVSEPVRILRIPGSLNFKPDYPEPRAVVLERLC